MTPADLHGHDNELAQGAELAREAGVEAGEAEGEADGAVGGDDFEEDGEEAEGVLVWVFEAGAFDDGNEEEAEEDEPEVERELAAEVMGKVGRLGVVFVVVAGPNTKRLLFVDVGLSHRHGDWEDRNIHHN